MKTICICIDWFHPAYKAGGPVQSIANLVEQYQPEGIRYRIFCSNTDLDGSINVGVVYNQWVPYNACTEVWYASKSSLSVKLVRDVIGACKPDILFVVGIYSWYFNLLPLLLVKAPLKIISVRGMLHAGALSQKSFKKRVYLQGWKLLGIHRRYFFHATDVVEKGFIQQYFGRQTRVFVAGNIPRVFRFQPAVNKQAGALRMVSIALISPMKNIALVLDALKNCKKAIEYVIYGPVKDRDYWEECRKKIALLPSNILVSYKMDLVPAKVADTLNESELFILPSKSENFGHAMIEALSAGKPVITSHNTPFNELEGNWAGKNVSVSNLSEITDAIDFFAAMSPEEFLKWNRGANRYAASRMDLQGLKAQYDAMFLVDGRRRKVVGGS